jgi:hypothetical protein
VLDTQQRNAQLKELLTTKEALGIICYNKHHNQKRVSCSRLSELLKIPINRIKEVSLKLEELNVVTIIKLGTDQELEFIENENEDIKHTIDEAIWENKQEYGKIYKKLITTELLDFMEGDK